MAQRAATAHAGFRAGLHTGECDKPGHGNPRGPGIDVAAVVLKSAEPGEILVSNTVRDLVAGSGIRFEERGPLELPGQPAQWRLFRVERGMVSAR